MNIINDIWFSPAWVKLIWVIALIILGFFLIYLWQTFRTGSQTSEKEKKNGK